MSKDKDKRKYEFESKVKVPDISEISKIAADFSDPVMPKNKSSVKESLSKRAKVAKLDSNITDMQRQMNKLAREVVKEETTQKEDTDISAGQEQKNDDKSVEAKTDDTQISEEKIAEKEPEKKKSNEKKTETSEDTKKSKKKSSDKKNDDKE